MLATMRNSLRGEGFEEEKEYVAFVKTA